ncbi:MAG: hypothetical protein MdMp014T_1721 [Treponematales bacterium]
MKEPNRRLDRGIIAADGLRSLCRRPSFPSPWSPGSTKPPGQGRCIGRGKGDISPIQRSCIDRYTMAAPAKARGLPLRGRDAEAGGTGNPPGGPQGGFFAPDAGFGSLDPRPEEPA